MCESLLPVATTRAPQDITNPDSYKRLSLGPAYIYLQPEDRVGDPAAAAAVADAIEVGRVRTERDTSLYLEATVVLGKDWVLAEDPG